MAIPDKKFPKKLLKFKKYQGYTQKGNEISFWASLVSIFIYMFIFYIFSLSPSSVLNTTEFWFFLTNTLILIISADFGAFSLSRKQKDCYDEYINTSEKNNLTIVGSQYQDIVNATVPLVNVENLHENREEIKEVVHVDGCETKPMGKKLQIILKNDFKKLSKRCLQDVPRITQQVGDDFKFCGKIVRTMCELSAPVEDLEDKTSLCQNESDSYEKKEKGHGEQREFSTMTNEELNRRVEEFSLCQNESDSYEKKEQGHGEQREFSTMTNEELNRRVEEFIRRSNRQIRLNAESIKYR